MAKGRKGNISDKQRKAMHANMRARGVALGKTPQGTDADLNRSANVFPNTPANLKEWSKPGGSRRMDIEGVDTKPKMVMQITLENVTPDKATKYFTQNKAKLLVSKMTDRKLSEMSDEDIRKNNVIITDYINLIESDDPHSKRLLIDGGYYGSVLDQDAVGISPNDIWLHQNLKHSQKLIDDERMKRKTHTFKVDSTLLNEDILRMAHSGTSFDPERRAKMEVEYFKAEVQSVYDELKEYATTPEQKKQLNEEMVKFQKKYAEKYNDILATRGRMLSPMITGPANFPVSRNKKTISSYENKVHAKDKFRDKVVGGIKRRWRKENIESAGGERVILERDLKDARNEHNRMIEANKITRKKIPDSEKITLLKDLGFTDKDIADSIPKTVAKKGGKFDKEKISTGGFEWAKGTISDIKFNVAGSKADIKRMEGRLWVIDKRKATPTGSNKFSGGEIVDNNEADRVQILFDDKPDDTMRGKLKGEGWRWSPRNSAWQRKRTDAAMRSAKRIVGA